MGKYSGYLLCSDFDSTLAVNSVIPQKNLDAIKYFCDEGGIFSVVTGRNVGFLEKYTPDLCLDAYVACLNGAEIYHFPTKKLINATIVPESTKEKMSTILSELDCITDVRVFGIYESTIVYKTAPDFFERVMTLLEQPARKLLIHSNTPFNSSDMDYIKSVFGVQFEIARSWAHGVEILNVISTKGIAARQMAQLVGAHTLICIGDYENDLSMLKAADISYAVENAMPEIKEAAMHVTVSAQEGAIAAIIDELSHTTG